MNTFAKFVTVVLALAVIAPATAGAQTTAELQAQIQLLLAQIATLQSQLTTGGSTSGSASYTYTADLTLGSKGADVSALQGFLYSKGFLKVAATGYFGPLTKAALASYQASVGISPASGYFGPITRAHFNAMVTVTPTTTTTTSPTPSTSPLTGGEGIMTITEYGTPAESVKVYEGATDSGLLGVQIEADGSDLRIERVKVDLGTSVTAYTKKFDQMSIWDGSTMLSKIDLSASNVQKEGSNYYVYFTGLNTVVTKDTKKVLTVKGDIYSVVESGNQGSHTLTIPANGIRAIDAMGLDIYGPTSAFTHAVNIQSSLSEQAELTVSENSNSPDSTTIVSDNQGEVNEATVLAVDLESEDGLTYVDQVVVNFAGNATETVAYLYDGSSLLQSATVSDNVATFTDLENYLRIAKDTTKTVTVKVDYTGATAAAATSTATFDVDTALLAYREDGEALSAGSTLNGSDVTSEVMYVQTAGPVFTMVSSNISWNDPDGTSSDVLTGQFVVTVKAEGGAVWIPVDGSATEAWDAMIGTAVDAAAATSTGLAVSYAQPSSGTTLVNNTVHDYYKINEGNSATFTVNVAFDRADFTAASLSSDFYMFYVNNVNWDDDGADAAADSDASYVDQTLKTGTAYATL